MMAVNVSNDVAAFRASIDRFKDQDMNRAIAIALNRAADGVRVAASAEIMKLYRVKKNALTKAFTVRRAYHGKLTAIVFASGKPLNVMGFHARQTKKGVTVDVKGARKLIPGAFIKTIQVPNAGLVKAVFERKFVSGRSGKRFGKYPLRGVTTVSVPGMFSKEVVVNALRGVAVDRFRKELASAVRAITLKAI
jgi:hypothetical protein